MKYFLFNHSGSLNHGCEAIIRGTVNIIENSDPDAEFVLVSYNAESDRILPENVEVCPWTTRELSKTEKIIAAFNFKILHSEEYTISRYHSPIIDFASDCDICLSVGGDAYCYGDNSIIRTVTRELKKAGKKVVLWGASIGEEDFTDEKLDSLKDFDAIFARESLTENLLKSRGANENIFLHSDPAFCMERDEMTLPEGFTKDNTLGINVSPLVASHNPEITEAVKGFIKHVIDNTTLKILLVPHVVEHNNNDYDYMLPFYKEFEKSGRIEILPSDLNAKQYKGCISKMRFFIGARTHVTIAAYSSGVPTFVIGYSVKSRGIATDLFGNTDYVLDVKKTESSDDLIKALDILIRDENKIKETFMRKIPMQLRSAMQMGETLKKI